MAESLPVPESNNSPPGRRPQFSLMAILVGMTALAIAFGLVRVLAGDRTETALLSLSVLMFIYVAEALVALPTLRMNAPKWVTASLACGWAGTFPGQLAIGFLVLYLPLSDERVGEYTASGNDFYLEAGFQCLIFNLFLFGGTTLAAMLFLLVSRLLASHQFKRLSALSMACITGGFIGASVPLLFRPESAIYYLRWVPITLIAGMVLPLALLSVARWKRLPMS